MTAGAVLMVGRFYPSGVQLISLAEIGGGVATACGPPSPLLRDLEALRCAR